MTAGVRKPSHLRPDGTCAPVSCAFRLREFCRTSNTVMVGTLSYSGCAEMSCRYTDAASATSRDRAPTYGPTLPSPPPRQQLSAHGLRPILGLCSAISALWPLMAQGRPIRPPRIGPLTGEHRPRTRAPMRWTARPSLPSRPREFHPEPLTDSGRDTLASSGSCHRTKAAAFR